MESKKNPIIKVDWSELRRWRPSRITIIVLIGVIIVFFGSRSISSYYDRWIEFYDAKVQVAEASRLEAEDAQKQAEEDKILIEKESEEKRTESIKKINTLQKNITRLRRSVSTLKETNIQLQEELVLAPEEIISTTDEDLASSISPKIDKIYPDFLGSTLIFQPEKNVFVGDRMFANAVRLSLDEVMSLRFQTGNQQSIINDQDKEIFSFQQVTKEKDVQIIGWKNKYDASETLNDLKSDTIIAFTDEKDAWENKSRAQSKRIFLYKWTSRVGISAAIVLGVIVASK